MYRLSSTTVLSFVLAGMTLLVSPPLLADVIVTKKGRKVQGKVVDETRDHVVIKVESKGLVSVKKKDIIRWVKDKKPVFVFHLHDGRKLVGTYIQDGPEKVMIQLKYGRVTLDRSQIRKVEPKKPWHQVYEEKKKKVDFNKAEDHLKLGRWCLRQNRYEEAHFHLKSALEIKPKLKKYKLAYYQFRIDNIKHRKDLYSSKKGRAAQLFDLAGEHRKVARWCRDQKLTKQALVQLEKAYALAPKRKGLVDELYRAYVRHHSPRTGGDFLATRRWCRSQGMAKWAKKALEKAFSAPSDKKFEKYIADCRKKRGFTYFLARKLYRQHHLPRGKGTYSRKDHLLLGRLCLKNELYGRAHKHFEKVMTGKGDEIAGIAEKLSRHIKLYRKAQEDALAWLVRHQSPQGYWKSAKFDQHCPRSPSCQTFLPMPSKDVGSRDRKIGRGAGGHDVGISALALLALLDQGHTPHQGKYKQAVAKGVKWLLSRQYHHKKDPHHGAIGYKWRHQGKWKKATSIQWIYDHTLATTVLARVYLETEDSRYYDPAQHAVNFLVRSQNPQLGWRYDDRSVDKAIQPGKSDTSVTAFAALALGEARRTKWMFFGKPLSVPEKAFQGAREWCRRVTGSSGQAGYMTPGGPSSVWRGRDGLYKSLPTMTGASLYIRITAGESPQKESIKKGLSLLTSKLPKWTKNNHKSANMIYWYWGGWAMARSGDRSWYDGTRQKDRSELKGSSSTCWLVALKKSLILTQQQGKKCGHGSWDPVCEWGFVGGRVYSTALGSLILGLCEREEFGKRGKTQ